MPGPAFFEQFAILSIHDFLPVEFCRQLCFEMQNATTTVGAIWNPHTGDHVEEAVKKRKEIIGLSPEVESLIREKLLRRMPQLADHFKVELSGIQPLKFTRYDKDDYYRMHLDVSPHQDAPSILNDRKVSIIVFMNQEGGELEEGDYRGGNLTFYGLLGDRQWQGVGLPLMSNTGLLIAFRPDTFHEVTPVTEGSRFTLTTWFV
jgi:SM-20-related protein